MLCKQKFIQALKNINHLQIYQQRQWNTMYKNKTCKYWNAFLYYNFIEDYTIYGISVDFKEFELYFNTLEDKKIKQLFNLMKNNMGDSIFLNDFDIFLNHLSNKDYDNLMNCLERDDSLINIDIDIDTTTTTNNESLSNEIENHNILCFDFLEFYEIKPNNFFKCIFCGCIA